MRYLDLFIDYSNVEIRRLPFWFVVQFVVPLIFSHLSTFPSFPVIVFLHLPAFPRTQPLLSGFLVAITRTVQPSGIGRSPVATVPRSTLPSSLEGLGNGRSAQAASHNINLTEVGRVLPPQFQLSLFERLDLLLQGLLLYSCTCTEPDLVMASGEVAMAQANEL